MAAKTKERDAGTLMAKGTVIEEAESFAEIVKNFIGQKVAVLCARYQYRGRLSCVSKDGTTIVLADATSVEVSGSADRDTPDSEDPISGSVVIKTDAVEIFYQPKWSQADLAGD